MKDISSFGISILNGILMGIIFDLYRALRYFSKPKKVLMFIEDLVFWIIIIITLFMLLVKTTDGILRGFFFVGSFCGLMLYMILLSKFLFSIFISIFKLILELISEIIKLLVHPFFKGFSVFKKTLYKNISIMKVLFKEMIRYRKIISRKK